MDAAKAHNSVRSPGSPSGIGRGAFAVGVFVLSVCALLTLNAGAASVSRRIPAGKLLTIRVLSNRADLISGGEALVGVFLPSGVSPSAVRVTLGRKDVTSDLAAGRLAGLMSGVPAHNLLGLDHRANALVGLVTGLHHGRNLLKALLPDGDGARITITNHPIGGPVFSGPQVNPWTCNAGAADAQCDRAASYQYFYMPASLSGVPDPSSFQTPDPRFVPYDPSHPPAAAAIAQTTTDVGQTVPFVVRVEIGTIDRGQYNIATLYDPSRPWSPWSPQRGWDHKLLLFGGAGCGITYAEGTAPNVLLAKALRRGFAVASNLLDATGSDCNAVTQAESEMMTKEHLIDEYGLVRYTLGIGGSGEAIVQQAVSNAYPGIYDGLIPEASFPDGWTNQQKTDDCVQLSRYWENAAGWGTGVTWTPADMSVVEAGDLPSSCAAWVATFGGSLFTPTTANKAVAGSTTYNPASNPCGVRTTLWDYSVNMLGRRPAAAWTAPEKACASGFANRPLDNLGVEYGLNGLLAGRLTPAQFADLNAKLGGRNVDYNWIAQRTQADPAGLSAIYRSGEVNEGDNMHLPIIDIRSEASGEVHDTYHSFSMRARLDRANGNHDNQVIWLSHDQSGFVVDPVLEQQAFNLMNRWLDAIEADSSNRSFAQKVGSDKPAGAVDRCTATSGVPAPCVVPASGSPRLGAGEALADDTWQCQLKALNRNDFPLKVAFTASEWSALQKAFPTGVCDYSKPGVNQQPTVPWLTYQSAQADVIYGGRPLGLAPVSIPFGPGGSCARASGRLAGRSLGRLTLGMKRSRARQLFTHWSNMGRRYVDFFCLIPGGLRAGYPSPALLRTLSSAERRRVQGRVVLALTASRHYALQGVRRGARLAAVARRLQVGRGFRIGQNRWYLLPSRRARGVLKVRRGLVEEVGIADVRLTNGWNAAFRFLRSFT
jgi:hypothetical protein